MVIAVGSRKAIDGWWAFVEVLLSYLFFAPVPVKISRNCAKPSSGKRPWNVTNQTLFRERKIILPNDNDKRFRCSLYPYRVHLSTSITVIVRMHLATTPYVVYLFGNTSDLKDKLLVPCWRSCCSSSQTYRVQDPSDMNIEHAYQPVRYLHQLNGNHSPEVSVLEFVSFGLSAPSMFVRYHCVNSLVLGLIFEGRRLRLGDETLDEKIASRQTM
ncbi:hypothetical protein BJ875DRAFT_183434 [Amylocarpus encephaloides]|uniref:Uncharacterized protein n=1 Tax=Amylocarpus encephaloides TaxID=45428 RepID=A0A9P7YNX8_9HELO|nr:hypothetical protein BJ875DRAFT_183434 [Amylocarpus encephaloides]